MKKVLFVCTGNTCRSPMAESIFKHILKARGIKDVKAQSCGIAACEGAPMSPLAREALKLSGIKPHPHKARQFRPEMKHAFNLVVTMTPAHKSAVGGGKNVLTAGEAGGCDVPDPYGGTPEQYRIAAAQLHNLCEAVLLLLQCN